MWDTFIIHFIEYFFLSITAVFFQGKMLRLSSRRKDFFLNACTFMALSAFSCLFDILMSPCSIYIQLFLLVLFSYFFTISMERKFTIILCSMTASFLVSYLLLFLIEQSTYLWTESLFAEKMSPFRQNLLSVLIAGLLLPILSWLLVKLPFIRKVLPNMNQKFHSETCLLINTSLLFISTIVFSGTYDHYFTIASVVLFLIIIVMFVITGWRARILRIHNDTSNADVIEILKAMLTDQQEQISNLVRLLQDEKQFWEDSSHFSFLPPSKEMDNLVTRQDALLQNLSAYTLSLPKTGIASTDLILSYISREASIYSVHFHMNVTGELENMFRPSCPENLINSLISDLAINAIRTMTNSPERNLLISLGLRDNIPFIDVFDSGENYNRNVLLALRRKRLRTASDSPVNERKFMLLLTLIKSKRASFELEEFSSSSLYTRRTSVIFDNDARIKILKEWG